GAGLQLRRYATARRVPRKSRRRRHARGRGRRRRDRARASGRGARQVTDVWPGRPYPLGATWDGEGVNFSIFSEGAERIELCLFDGQDNEERVELTERTAFNWHGYVPGLAPGQRYAYRV